MRYINQLGERISETEAKSSLIEAADVMEIKGWAIDVGNCEHGEYEEFIRLWKKIKPKPLYTLFNY